MKDKKLRKVLRFTKSYDDIFKVEEYSLGCIDDLWLRIECLEKYLDIYLQCSEPHDSSKYVKNNKNKRGK